MLGVTDDEMSYFRKDVTEFENIDKQIKEIKDKMKPYQEKLKELNAKKKEKQNDVMNFMKANDLDSCNTNNGIIEVKDKKITKAISKADVYDRIYKFFSEEIDKMDKKMTNQQKAEFLHNFIYVEGREVKNDTVLKSK
tara:strand:- start:2334 stop:2747 length:414 start_codon:yes stop_codon:yes gene_type:complete